MSLNLVSFHEGPCFRYSAAGAPWDPCAVAFIPTVLDVTLPASSLVARPILESESTEHIFIQKLFATHQCLKEKSDLSFFFFFLENLRGNHAYY